MKTELADIKPILLITLKVDLGEGGVYSSMNFKHT